MKARITPVTRLAVAVAIVMVGAVSLTACSAMGGAAGGSAQQQAQGAGQGQGRPPGVSGEITGVAGTTISVQSANAASQVEISSATQLTRSVSGTLADVSVGSCVLARALPGASSSGTQAVSTVAISAPASDGTCSAGTAGPGGGPRAGGYGGGGGGYAGGGGGGGGGAGQGGFTPPVQGSVTAVSGSTITVQPAAGASSSAPSSFVVDSSTTYTRTESATASDIATGQCIVARGTTAASGSIQASTVTISDKGANGCSSGFGGRPTGANG